MNFSARIAARLGLSISLVCSTAAAGAAVPWLALGPFGGDARSFSVDPHNPAHIYLGSATGWIYQTLDSGATWQRLARLGKRDDLVLDHVVIDSADSKHLLAGAWVVDRPDGGMFESHDGGMTWSDTAALHGQSVRSMATSLSNPRMVVAGTLTGVYRSEDFGGHWSRITPEGSVELREIESLAVDPTNPQIIFAGTWHLPWRTMDGGAHWTNITEKDGIHDDSDIFSIIIDPQQPKVVYASACSGIYKSVNGGFQFERTRKEALGLDHMSIRTRKLMQDPTRPQIVFAGTTEGLWRTLDAGGKWVRLTANNVIVNDVFVDPANPNHVLIATDRGGVLTSTDDGLTFHDGNNGYSARQVTAFTEDPMHPATLYTGLVNDKAAGGVFMSLDGGVHWQQQSVGLNGRDVFSLGALMDGTVLAGTNHGIYRMDSGGWTAANSLIGSVPLAGSAPIVRDAPAAANATPSKTVSAAAFSAAASGKAAPAAVKKPVPHRVVSKTAAPATTTLDAVVYAIAPVGDTVYAGTSNGLIVSTTSGRQWTTVGALQMPETRFVAAQKQIVMAASLRRIALSVDAGKTWDAIAVPEAITQLTAVAVDELNNLWIGGREGVYYSTDYGLTWKTLQNLYMTEVSDVHFDAIGHRVIVTSLNSSLVFAAHLPDYKVTYRDAGWNLRFARSVGDHFVGATLFDGMVVQPMIVDSKVASLQ